ncbi:MAG: RNA polymerase sigma factor [Clostridia bacterium]
MKINDKELERIFFEIKQNKINGIENLYNKYKKVVYGIAFMITKNQEDAEDIMQIVFVKIYELENSKNPINNYASWLYSITKNETINFLKKKKNDISLDKIYEIPNDNDELNEIIDNIEFNKLISNLKDKEKEIISLKIVSNFSFQEIAKLLKEPVGTVKWRYYKSIYNLKAILGNLAIFIISSVIGTKALLSREKIENISKIENLEQNSTTKEELTNSTLSDENIFKDETKNSSNGIKKEENIRQDIDTNTNIIQNNNINIQENTIYQEQQNNNYNQYIGYSFLGISIIFFIITLYFFIKYQPKHLKKLSK